MSNRLVNALPADLALRELRNLLDEHMRIWHISTGKARDVADGYTDGLACGASLLAGTTTFDELKASEHRIRLVSK